MKKVVFFLVFLVICIFCSGCGTYGTGKTIGYIIEIKDNDPTVFLGTELNSDKSDAVKYFIEGKNRITFRLGLQKTLGARLLTAAENKEKILLTFSRHLAWNEVIDFEVVK